MRGIGARAAKSFWADAWDRVRARPGAVFGIVWISIMGFFAVFAPLLANAHPILMEQLAADGSVEARSFPLISYLTPTDWLLMAGSIFGLPWVFFGPAALGRSLRIAVLAALLAQGGATIVLSQVFVWTSEGSSLPWLRAWARLDAGPWPLIALAGLLSAVVAVAVPIILSPRRRVLAVALVAAASSALVWATGAPTIVNHEKILLDESAGRIRAVWTMIPWSPE